MPTETDKNQQNSEKSQLTDRQLKAIPVIAASSTYSQGCKRARINRTTFYEWLKEPLFKAELDRKHREIAEEAFKTLENSLTKAVTALTGLLDTNDSRLKRLVCNDIIGHIVQYKEIAELNDRLASIEQKLAEKSD